MRRVNNREEFKEYCLRSLGAPVLKINASNDQLEDRIDEALEMFHGYHMDGSTKEFLIIQLTAQHIAQQYIDLPDRVTSVVRMLVVNSSRPMINLQYQMYMNDVMNQRAMNTNGIHGYAIALQHIDLINDLFNSEKLLTFNQYNRKLRIQTDWSNFSEGEFIIVECYMSVDMDNSAAWNDIWLKLYTTALFKRQWGMNLSKFSGAQLPGGVTTNGLELLAEAKAEIEVLEDRLRNEFQEPVNFFVG